MMKREGRRLPATAASSGLGLLSPPAPAPGPRRRFPSAAAGRSRRCPGEGRAARPAPPRSAPHRPDPIRPAPIRSDPIRGDFRGPARGGAPDPLRSAPHRAGGGSPGNFRACLELCESRCQVGERESCKLQASKHPSLRSWVVVNLPR